MDIFVTQSNEILIESKKRNVQVKVLSSAPEKLPTFVQEKFHELERETRHGRRVPRGCDSFFATV